MNEQRRYEILATLGKGGFGTVYKARMHGAGGFTKLVALKILNPELEDMDELARRTRDEARVLGLIRHRALVQVDGLVRIDSRWTIVMEYVPGVDLTRVISAGPLPPSIVLEITEEVSKALEAAQIQPGPDGQPLRLLHRDLKPSNIRLTELGELKVLDFGTARAEFSSREAKTRSVTFGTVQYMAPERLDLEDVPAGDVYSLGVVCFELLTGEELGRCSPRKDRHEQLVSQAGERMRARSVPEPIITFVQKMLSYEPEDRPLIGDIDNVCRELRAGLAGPWLADWAEQNVPKLVVEHGEDSQAGLTGAMLTEDAVTNSIVLDPNAVQAPPPPPVGPSQAPQTTAIAKPDSGGGFLLTGFAAVVLLGGLGVCGAGLATLARALGL